jgi:hypothetical protein
MIPSLNQVFDSKKKYCTLLKPANFSSSCEHQVLQV